MTLFEKIQSKFQSSNPIIPNPNKQMNAGYDSIGHLQRYVANKIHTVPVGQEYHEKGRDFLVGASRDYFRNNAIYRGLINRLVNYIIGDGFKLQVYNEDSKIVDKIENGFKSFMANPDVRELLDDSTFTQYICKEYILTGEVFILLLENGKVQIIESEQIRKNAKGNGIEYDEFGKPLFFHVTPYKKNGTLNYEKTVKVEASNMLYMTDIERISGSRGLPLFQASFPILEHLDNVIENESIAWDILTRMIGVINTNPVPGLPGGLDMLSNSQNTNDEKSRILEIDRATFINADKDESIQMFDRKIPQNNFEASIVMFMRILGLPLNIPYEMFLGDFSKLNYSQARTLLEQSFQVFSIIQKNIIKNVMVKLLKWKYESIREDNQILASIPLSEIKYDFIPPSMPWFNPLEEIKSVEKFREMGISSYTETLKSRGKNADEMQNQIYREIGEAINLSKKMYEEYGVNVPYNVFCGLPLTVKNDINSNVNIESNNENKETI